MPDFHDRLRSDTFATPMRFILFILLSCLLFLFAASGGFAQGTLQLDSVINGSTTQADPQLDDSVQSTDSTALSKAPVNLGRYRLSAEIDPAEASGPALAYGTATADYIRKHPQYRAAETSLRLRELERKPLGREWIFYLFAIMLLFLSLVRLAFPKYVNDMFRVFFNTSMRQKQLKDQLIQEPLPSIFLNLFFVVSGGVYLYFLLAPTAIVRTYPTGTVLGGSMALLASVYVVKFVVLRSLGWIFGKGEAAESYLFVVFMVNKITGLVIVPFTILLAYADVGTRSIWLTASYIALAILLLYRLIRGYGIVRKSLRINQLYFLLFVIAFELIPILLLYKGLNTLF